MTRRDFQESVLVQVIAARGAPPDPADVIAEPGEDPVDTAARVAEIQAARDAYRDDLIAVFQFAGNVHDVLPP